MKRGTIKEVAKELARQRGYDPDGLEPGDIPKIDAILPNGDPAHYMWRQYTKKAKVIIDLIKKLNS